jgi:hypothetical protein
MDWPSVVLSQGPREVFVTKLGPGLVDANELELGSPFDGWGRRVERRPGCRQSWASRGQTEKNAEKFHCCVGPKYSGRVCLEDVILRTAGIFAAFFLLFHSDR